MRRLTVKRKVTTGKDSRNRPITSWETLDAYLRAFTVSPLESSDIEAMNLMSATEAFNIVVKGVVDLSTSDVVVYQGKDFSIESIKRFTEGHNRLKVTVITIARKGVDDD